MNVRVALASLRFPASPEASVQLAEEAIAQAAREGAAIICFPECYVPGYRSRQREVAAPDAAFLERAWSQVAAAAGKENIAVILGTERVENGTLIISALVINAEGSIAGFQDKEQIDPSEESIYTAGSGRRMFACGPVTFGISICHEAWRYPETVRWAAKRGAQVVFHPFFHEAEVGGHRPTMFRDPENTFHEKAMLCRAAENTCWFASVNCATDGAPATSAIIRPDGTVLAWQPYGKEGLLIADLDLSQATGLLAKRSKY